jgi:hypothetical protein
MIDITEIAAMSPGLSWLLVFLVAIVGVWKAAKLLIAALK